jgi:hypothetical protein
MERHRNNEAGLAEGKIGFQCPARLQQQATTSHAKVLPAVKLQLEQCRAQLARVDT